MLLIVEVQANYHHQPLFPASEDPLSKNRPTSTFGTAFQAITRSILGTAAVAVARVLLYGMHSLSKTSGGSISTLEFFFTMWKVLSSLILGM
jgi:hypothetical protein